CACCGAWRDVRPGGRLGERLEVDGVGVDTPLAGRDGGRAGVAGLLERAFEPAASVAEPGAGGGGRGDLRAAGTDGLEPASARGRARCQTTAFDRSPGPATRRLFPAAQA